MPCSCSPFRGFDIVRGEVDGGVSRNWQPEGGWRYSKLDPHRDFLIRRLAEQDDITMPELAAELAGHGTVVAPSSISRWLIRNGYRFKKTLLASEQDRPDVAAARQTWVARQPRMQLEPHRLVFIDETGTATKMTRLRGRCPKGQRLRSKAPFGHWKTQAFIAGLRCFGLTAPLRDRQTDEPAHL